MKMFNIAAGLVSLALAAQPNAMVEGYSYWADDHITISDMTYSITEGKEPLHEVAKAVEEYNRQQGNFEFKYTRESCDKVQGPCWTVEEITTHEWYAGQASFAERDSMRGREVYACNITLNTNYGSSVHVIMHEMFHCFAYRDKEGVDNDILHSDKHDSIISLVNHGGTTLSKDDLDFLDKVDPFEDMLS